jgi:2-methylisocitrate lyase-like PEP mutase family enzyme
VILPDAHNVGWIFFPAGTSCALMTSVSAENARLFHRLHHEGLLLLANAWDAGSARLIESVGAKAIATTSAAVAWSHGYADGNFLPMPLLVSTVAGIARVIRVPLSVDMEGGYADDPAKVAENVAAVIGAGAVGINLEDGTGSPELLCAKIEQVRRAAIRLGVDLYVNARTDTYLRNTIPPERRIEETLARAERYRAAGASGIFVPGVVDATAIKTLAASIKLPMNVLARTGLPAAAKLAALGVRRLSAGSGIPEVLYGRIAALAADFQRTGVSAPLIEGAMPYRDINELMAARS